MGINRRESRTGVLHAIAGRYFVDALSQMYCK